VALAFRARYGVDVSAKSSCLEKAKLWILGVHVRGRTTAAQPCGFLRRTGAWCVLVGTRSTRCKARSLRVAVGSNTCKTTGMARRPALKRRRVCAAARCGNRLTHELTRLGQPHLQGRFHSKRGHRRSPC
jgi:hypothetical protein